MAARVLSDGDGGWHGRVVERTGDKQLMGTCGADLTGEKIQIRIVNGEVLLRTGRAREGAELLKTLMGGEASTRARAAAERLLAETPGDKHTSGAAKN